MLKRSRILISLASLLVAALGGGCGGMSGSYSASPASILVPGLMKATPVADPFSPAVVQTNAAPALLAGR